MIPITTTVTLKVPSFSVFFYCLATGLVALTRQRFHSFAQGLLKIKTLFHNETSRLGDNIILMLKRAAWRRKMSLPEPTKVRVAKLVLQLDLNEVLHDAHFFTTVLRRRWMRQPSANKITYHQGISRLQEQAYVVWRKAEISNVVRHLRFLRDS